MGLHHSIIMENLSLIIIEIDCAKFNRSFIHIFIKLGWWIGALKKERKETKKGDFKLKVNQPRSIQWKSIRHRKNEKSKKTQENCHPKATLNIMTVPFSALHTAKSDVLMWNLVCLSWSSLSDISAFCCFFVIIKDIFHCWFWVWGLLVFCKINGILVGSLFYCRKPFHILIIVPSSYIQKQFLFKLCWDELLGLYFLTEPLSPISVVNISIKKCTPLAT